MPGSLVSDANATNLLTGATLNAAGTTNGNAVQVDRPGRVDFRLLTGTVTGTSPTLSITLQGCDASAFASAVVTYGKIDLLSGTAAAQSNVAKSLQAHAYHKYVRAASVTLGGTSPVYTGSTLYVNPEHFLETHPTDSASV